MAFLIIGLLTLFSVAVVIYPFVRKAGGQEGQPEEGGESTAARREREGIYTEIRALQLEYQLGTLEEPEYRRQLQRYRIEAAHLIRDQDFAQLGIELEDEILAQRSVAKAVSPPNTCPKCGSTISGPGEVCPNCIAVPPSSMSTEDNDRADS